MSGICVHCHGQGVMSDEPTLHCMFCHGTGVMKLVAFPYLISHDKVETVPVEALKEEVGV